MTHEDAVKATRQRHKDAIEYGLKAMADPEKPEGHTCRTCDQPALPYSDYCHKCYWGKEGGDE